MLHGLLTATDEAILRAVYRYRYMTLTDVHYLLFSPSVLTYVRKLLSELSGGDFAKGHYLYRFFLPDTRRGNPTRVYTLGKRGRDYARQVLGLPDSWYYNPDRAEKAGFLHLQHALALTQALVSTQKWSEKLESFKLVTVRTCYELARLQQMKEALPAIPDAWLLFLKDGRRFPVLLEIDLGTENIKKFKEHIMSRIDFIQSGKYEEVFELPVVTIAYLNISNETRQKAMIKWTEELLKDMKMQEWGQIFRIGYIQPQEIYNVALFVRDVWREPFEKPSVPLFG
jgi:hypothetical protein